MASIIYNPETAKYILNPVEKAALLQRVRDQDFAIYLTDNPRLLEAFERIASHIGYESETRLPEMAFTYFEPTTMEELAAKAMMALFLSPLEFTIVGSPEE